jgi:release factor glutamine methyltransferase
MLDALAEQGAAPLTVADAIRVLATAFRAEGLPTPELDARLLVLGACGLSHTDYILSPKRPVTPDDVRLILAFSGRRLAREPVSRILGRRPFWGRDFLLGPATLDPRPETETLVEAVLAAVDAEGRRDRPLRMLDLGTGTGCILLSLLAELPKAWGVGIDIEGQALRVARHNAELHGLQKRAAFCCADWAEPFLGGFDYIMANPPYIESNAIADLEPEVRTYDPKRALDGGEDGLDAYRRIAVGARGALARGGYLVLEAGAGQMDRICGLLVKAGWQADPTSYRVVKDLLGQDRVVVVRKHG